jgi:hypothetical protein
MEDRGMAIVRAPELIATALIELEYLAADLFYVAKSQSDNEETRRMRTAYQSACKALEIALDVIEEADAAKNRALVA